jgi:hypothetical protein
VDFAEDNGQRRYKTQCTVADGAHLPMSAHDKVMFQNMVAEIEQRR